MKSEANQTANKAEEYFSISLQNTDESFGSKVKKVSSARHVNFKHLLREALSDNSQTILTNGGINNLQESSADSILNEDCIVRNNSQNLK